MLACTVSSPSPLRISRWFDFAIPQYETDRFFCFRKWLHSRRSRHNTHTLSTKAAIFISVSAFTAVLVVSLFGLGTKSQSAAETNVGEGAHLSSATVSTLARRGNNYPSVPRISIMSGCIRAPYPESVQVTHALKCCGPQFVNS